MSPRAANDWPVKYHTFTSRMNFAQLGRLRAFNSILNPAVAATKSGLRPQRPARKAVVAREGDLRSSWKLLIANGLACGGNCRI